MQIEKHQSWASKYFEVERDRDKQSLLMIFEGSKLHSNEAILTSQKHIESTFKQKVSIDELALSSHMSSCIIKIIHVIL